MQTDSKTSAFPFNFLQLYQEIFDSWVIQQLQTYPPHTIDLTTEQTPTTINIKLFSHYVKQQIYTLTKFQMSADNVAADAIVGLYRQGVDYQIWSIDSSSKQKQAAVLKRRKLMEIGNLLYSQKYITTRKKKQISEEFQEGQPIKSRIMKLLKQNISTQISETAKLKLWNKFIYIEFSEFWEKLFPLLLQEKERQQLRDLYIVFKNIIHNKVSQSIITKLYYEFEAVQVYSQQQIYQPSVLSRYLKYNATKLNLFDQNNRDILKQFNDRYEQAANIIFNQMLPTYPIQFQTYGSFKSQFCLTISDIDVTIFIQFNSNQQNESRQINKCLSKIQRILQKHQQSIGFKTSEHIRWARVPVLTINFYENSNIKGIDFVINNKYGVWNSLLFKNFSIHPIVQNFGILVKKWGKATDLIRRDRFSSYGLLTMTIYFLMATGKIPFLKSVDPNIPYQCKVSGVFQYEKIFLNFLDFYSEFSPFFCNNEVVCLIKNCQQHQHIYKGNKEPLINIHDPYDLTNPGRFKFKQRQFFFETIQRTKEIFKQSKTSICEELRTIFER